MTVQKATFGMGCFWGVEALFKKLPGVLETTVGYTGGHVQRPSYEKVSTGTTGHAEAVEIAFDSDTLSYEELLDVFWKFHDPTTLHQQGPDIGEQYRSVIFYHSPEQKEKAEASRKKREASGVYARPIVTEIVQAKEFYPAEEYHQDYLDKNPDAACHI